LAIVGDGGHAAVCADLARELGYSICSTFVESEFATETEPSALGPQWLSRVGDTDHNCDDFEGHNWLIAIGNGAARQRLAMRISAEFGRPRFPTIASPSASISSTSEVGEGCVIAAGANVSPNSIVGSFSILNASSNLEHHSRLGPFSHLAPGAVILGNASVGSNCFIGANSVVGQKVDLPAGSTLGALSFLNKSPIVQGVFVGSPARLSS